ncbi:MAG: nucleoside recognition protein, partial [Lachnospiraceae bacterium]
MKKSLLSAIAVVSLLFLLWQPKLASYGASQGLILWANVVLPTLLPFMICSNAIVALGGIPLLIWPFAPVLKGLFRLSSNGCYVLISGMLCGYPLGAKTCSDFLNEDMISPKEAACLLAVCNHPSPMFLLGYVMTSIREQVPAVFLLTALYLPILPLWFLSRFCYRQLDDGIPGNPLQKDRARYFDENLMTSCEVMV